MNRMRIKKRNRTCIQRQRNCICFIKTIGTREEAAQLGAVIRTRETALFMASIDNTKASIGLGGIIERQVNIGQQINMTTVMYPVG